jgi:hypothetical protein
MVLILRMFVDAGWGMSAENYRVSSRQKMNLVFHMQRSKVVSHLRFFVNRVYSLNGLNHQGTGTATTVTDADATKLATLGA